MNRTALKAISEAPPLSPPGQGQPDGVVPTPSPRPATCSEIGCNAPATGFAEVTTGDMLGENPSFALIDYCAPCAEKAGFDLLPYEAFAGISPC